MSFNLCVTNLFRYATSELSQDAFICWLLSHLTEDGWDSDPQIRECAMVFMNRILRSKNQQGYCDDWRIQKIEKQYDNIDVLVYFNDFRIILEDKVATNIHDNQIERYKEALLKSEPWLSRDNIITVYYKIFDQPRPEKGVDCEFTREDLLSIFRRYQETIENPIFRNYLEYLEWIEYRANSYQFLKIEDWTPDSYRGFFKHLQKDLESGPNPLWGKDCSWGYVSNPSGGFMALWLSDLFTSDELDAMGLTEDICDNLYLQIENDIIAVKYSVDPKNNPAPSKSTQARLTLYEYLRDQLDGEFEKKTFRYGTFMTVGYIRYNESNYHQQLAKILNALQALKCVGKII